MSGTIESVIIKEEPGSGSASEVVGGPPVVLDRNGQQRLAEKLVARARAQGLDLAGANGLLAQLTKRVLETALETGDLQPEAIALYRRLGWQPASGYGPWVENRESLCIILDLA